MGRKGYYVVIGVVLVVALAIIVPHEITVLRRNQVDEPETEVVEDELDMEALALEDIIEIEDLEEELTIDTSELEESMEEMREELVAAEERKLTTDLKISHRETQMVAPDKASLILAVQSRGEEIADVYEENAEAMDQARQALAEEYGLEFETLAYQIRQDEDEQYVVANRIKTTVDDLEILGDVIDLAIAEGINRLDNIEYDIENREQVQIETTNQAIEEIENKAERITGQFGAEEYRFDEIRIDDDFGTNTVRPVHYTATAEDLAREAVEITPGDIEFTTRIEAVVEF